MELKITLLFHCYSNGIPMKIPVTLPLIWFHCYSNGISIKVPVAFPLELFHCFSAVLLCACIVNMNAYIKLGEIFPCINLFSRLLSRNEILTSIKGHNSLQMWEKWCLTIVNINVYTKLGKILSRYWVETKFWRKGRNDSLTTQIQYSPTFSKWGYNKYVLR